MKKLLLILVVLLLSACLASCRDKRETNQKTAVDDQVKVLATVNGVPITEYDLKQILRRVGGHGESPNAEAAKNVLQNLIRDELIYQKSLQLGLDKNPEYRLKLSAVESQLHAFQKQEMSNLYRSYVLQKAEVTDAEAREYFEKNSQQLQTKFHVLQILYKGKYPEIVKDHQDVKSGMSFEKVAARRFPGLPKNIKAPWDLGLMSWNQMPPSWQGVVDRLEPGQVTDILKGDNDRFWLIKLVGKTVDSQITFATEKDKIIDILRQKKADALYNSMLSEMKDKAKIVYPQ